MGRIASKLCLFDLERARVDRHLVLQPAQLRMVFSLPLASKLPSSRRRRLRRSVTELCRASEDGTVVFSRTAPHYAPCSPCTCAHAADMGDHAPIFSPLSSGAPKSIPTPATMLQPDPSTKKQRTLYVGNMPSMPGSRLLNIRLAAQPAAQTSSHACGSWHGL